MTWITVMSSSYYDDCCTKVSSAVVQMLYSTAVDSISQYNAATRSLIFKVIMLNSQFALLTLLCQEVKLYDATEEL